MSTTRSGGKCNQIIIGDCCPACGQGLPYREEVWLNEDYLFVARGGISTHLSKKQMLVFSFLYKTKYPISSERLYIKLFGYDSDTDIKAVYVYISNINARLRKLGIVIKNNYSGYWVQVLPVKGERLRVEREESRPIRTHQAG